MMRNIGWMVCFGWLVAFTAEAFTEDKLPIKVVVLAGQSNMEGQAVVDLDGSDYNDGQGTLVTLLAQPNFAKEFSGLRDATGRWTTRDDVYVWYQREHEPLLAGPLSVGYSIYGDRHHFGPELELGRVVGDQLENPVLLIKTAWGGKSLHVDFRPPSAGGGVGPYYHLMISQVQEVVGALGEKFPQWQGRRAELAGFVWYHGWNDGVDPDLAVPAYEQNLTHLIHDLRRDLAAPQLPVVIGELTGPWVVAEGSWNALRQAQAAAAARPEFAGTVTFVATHDFVRKPEDSPNPGHGHHEFGNAETYLRVGRALGQGLLALWQETANDRSREQVDANDTLTSQLPHAHTTQSLEGWSIRVDDRLLSQDHAELRSLAMDFLSNKLRDIRAILPPDKVNPLQSITIVVDLSHGGLESMQYHPSDEWLAQHGYSRELAQCVHIPRAIDLATPRNINEQPWVILHELAHAYHDQILGFDDARIVAAYERYRASGNGERTLLYDGTRTRHYALTDEKEFFAEMTEAFFGVNDFFPFNRAELKESEPAIYSLMSDIWLSR